MGCWSEGGRRPASTLAAFAVAAGLDINSHSAIYDISNACLGALNGIYSCALWEPRNRRLSLFTDRYGYRLVYYYHDKQRQ